ncbi:MAG: aspartate carbamoyltransferase regulatory subunit, partial [Eubacteriales bacterium]|nr:aspartate carbamoyltransferase regulatory subunit [Eubacteriales bacterium]
MNIDSIHNGIVLDHIPAGKGMEIYRFLNLEALDCPVAIIKNAVSRRMGRKDIIKIDAILDINLDVLGYIAPDITVNMIRNGERVQKYSPQLPERLTDIVRCKNPRCITSTEQELPHVFLLTDRTNRVYRCLYCETQSTKYN